jgi:hypothetical protein
MKGEVKMDEMRICGVKESKGIFKDTQYHNVLFSGLTEPITVEGAGHEVDTVKVSMKVLSAAMGKTPTSAEIYALVGRVLKYRYNKDGKVPSVSFSDVTPATPQTAATAARPAPARQQPQ